MLAESEPVAQTDDEWRAEKFSEEVLVSARIADARGFKATYTQLLRALEAHGPDGILESAVMLPRDQYEKLEKLVKKTPVPKLPRRRR